MSAASEQPATAETENPALSRPQRRLLRRIFNGRTAPLTVDGLAFLTYRDASRYLLALSAEAREIAYLAMKQAASKQPAPSATPPCG